MHLTMKSVHIPSQTSRTRSLFFKGYVTAKEKYNTFQGQLGIHRTENKVDGKEPLSPQTLPSLT